MGAPAVARRAAAPARAPAPSRSGAPARRRRRRAASAAARKRPNSALASTRAATRTKAAPATRRIAPRQHPIRFAGGSAADAAAMLPHAAVRTAGAVRDLSDSSLIVRLTQGRGWIAVLGVLLAGIVALNVVILSLNSGAGVAGERIDAMERHNSALRAELAQKLAAGRVEADAAALGMYVPDAKDVTYLQAGKGDAAGAASALGGP